MSFFRRRYSGDGGYAPRGPFTLNQDSPQAQGLVGWWPLFGHDTHNHSSVASGTVVGKELSGFGGDAIANTARTLSPLIIPQHNIIVPDFDGEWHAACGVHAIQEVQNMTVCVRSVFQDALGSKLVFGKMDNIFAGGFECSHGNAAEGNINFAYWDGAVRGFYNIDIGWTAGLTADVAWTWNVGTFEGFRDGISRGTAATETNEIIYNGDTLDIGMAHTNQSFNGGLWDVRLYNRVLSYTELWNIHEPSTRWDLFWQPKIMVMASEAAVAAGGSFPPWITPITHLLAR